MAKTHCEREVEVDPLCEAVARVHAQVLASRYPGTIWTVRPVYAAKDDTAKDDTQHKARRGGR
jgi:hypothetical protein